MKIQKSNPLFAQMAKSNIPPMNPVVMNGYAMECMKHFEEHLDSQIRSITTSLPKCLKYIGFTRCSPNEEYEEATKPRSIKGGRSRSSSRRFDLADSYTYLVKFFFEFTDQAGRKHVIPRYVYLPYLDGPGTIMLSGNKNHIVPVISDKVFTPGRDSVFVRLTRDRNNVHQVYHSIAIDGKIETKYVAWFSIYRKKSASQIKQTTKALTCLSHYIFARHGFTEAFRRYTGTVPVIGTTDITPDAYPPEEWVIVSSAYGKNLPPSTCMDKVYDPTSIKLAIPRPAWTRQMEALVAGFFYVVDHFPSRFAADSKYYDSEALWKILMGHILFSGLHGENKLYTDVTEHFESIKDNLDTEVKNKLISIGLDFEDYFDLLNYLMVECNTMLAMRKTNGLNVFGKNLEVAYYIAYPILEGFVNLNFILSKMEQERPLTLPDVQKNLNIKIRMGAVFKMSNNRIIAETVSYSGDSLYPKITAVLTEQENNQGGQRSAAHRTNIGPEHRLDLSMIVLGSILFFPKSHPTPIARINPWAVIEPRSGTILENPKLKDLLEKTRPSVELP